MPRIKLSLPSIIWIGVLAISNASHLLPMLCAIVLHEAGHIACARTLGIRIACLRFGLLGARMETEGMIAYKKEFLLAFSGPLTGILGFFAAFPLHRCAGSESLSDFLFFFSLLSLCLSLFNLIPLSSLDGGRMLQCLLCRFLPLSRALFLMRCVTFLTLFALWLLSVYIMIKLSGGVTMFAFCLIFFIKCFILDTEK